MCSRQAQCRARTHGCQQQVGSAANSTSSTPSTIVLLFIPSQIDKGEQAAGAVEGEEEVGEVARAAGGIQLPAAWRAVASHCLVGHTFKHDQAVMLWLDTSFLLRGIRCGTFMQNMPACKAVGPRTLKRSCSRIHAHQTTFQPAIWTGNTGAASVGWLVAGGHIRPAQQPIRKAAQCALFIGAS